jgi:hypothetical protein
MDHQTVPVSAAEPLSRQNTSSRERGRAHVSPCRLLFAPQNAPRNNWHLALTGQTSSLRAHIRSSLLACLWPPSSNAPRQGSHGTTSTGDTWTLGDRTLPIEHALVRGATTKPEPRHSSPQVKVQQKPAQTSKAEPGPSEYPLTCTYTILRRMKRNSVRPVPVHIESPRSAHRGSRCPSKEVQQSPTVCHSAPVPPGGHSARSSPGELRSISTTLVTVAGRSVISRQASANGIRLASSQTEGFSAMLHATRLPRAVTRRISRPRSRGPMRPDGASREAILHRTARTVTIFMDEVPGRRRDRGSRTSPVLM